MAPAAALAVLGIGAIRDRAILSRASSLPAALATGAGAIYVYDFFAKGDFSLAAFAFLGGALLALAGIAVLWRWWLRRRPA